MLSFSYTLRDGTELPLRAVTEAVLDCSLEVPADSLRITAAYDGVVRAQAQALLVRDNGVLLFRGMLDRVVCTSSSSGTVTRLYARSAAGLLLDNEAEPLDYTNPSVALMERKHLQPFGIRAANTPRSVLRGHFHIDKGMSQWQVLERFCRVMYAARLRVSGDGTAYLNGLPRGETVIFGEGGIPVYALEEQQNPCRLLSKIHLRVKPGERYRSALTNANPACAAFRRERYVDVTAANRSIDTAQQMIDNSNAASYRVVLRCGGCQAALLGRTAQVRSRALGTLKSLRVTGVRTQLNNKGTVSIITLEKETF